MSLIAAILVAAFVVASGPPTTPPPEVGGSLGPGPPPAWMEAGRRSVWAAFGSYCWSAPGRSAVCVDMIPPATRPDLRIPATADTAVRLHLRFEPRSVRVHLVSAGTWKRVAAQGRRTVSWLARPGIFDVYVTGPSGSASYLVRLTSAKD